jgi:hypothetical protein
MLDNRDLVPVATFDHLSEAEVARSLLSAEGIAAAMKDEPLATLLPPVALANGGFTLLVSEDEVERARAVLTRPDSTEPPPEAEAEAEASADER